MFMFRVHGEQGDSAIIREPDMFDICALPYQSAYLQSRSS